MLRREPPKIPERKDVTVCIAAIAGGSSDPTIITCSDSLMSGTLGSAERGHKNRPMGRGWGLLTAGDDYEIAAMYELFSEGIRTAGLTRKGNFDEAAILTIVRESLTKRKLEKA